MQFEMTTSEPRVVPFSNGSEGEDWRIRNCDRCAKQHDCPMEESTAWGMVAGDIALVAAERIGWEPDPEQDGFGDLASPCREYEPTGEAGNHARGEGE